MTERFNERCVICNEVQNFENTQAEKPSITVVETICDSCEMNALAEVENFGVPSCDIEGDLALTKEMI